MNKAMYIASIVCAVVFLFTIGYYISEVSSAHAIQYTEEMLNATYGSHISSLSSLYTLSPERLTEQGGNVCLWFFVLLESVFIRGAWKGTNARIKAVSLTGLILGLACMVWDLIMMASPASMSFDEVGIGFLIFALLSLVFSIVGLIQSVKENKAEWIVGNPTKQMLDS